MTTTPVAPPPLHEPRPLLGLRRKPGRLALMFMRMPLRAYRHKAGWMLGHTFVEFTHIGRRSGEPHDAVAMVLRHDEDTREVVICAGWAETDWYRNLRAGPASKVQLGRDSFIPQHRFLTHDEAFDVAVQFRRRHPHRMRLITKIFGWGDLRDDDKVRAFVRAHPFVAFRPVTPAGVRVPAGRSERGAWLPPRWVIRLAWRAHRALFRLSGGRRGLWPARPDKWGAMRLTATGRRTGQERSVILGYFEDGPDLVTLAMNGWGTAEPAWWLNLQAQPRARAHLADGSTRDVVAHAASGEDRARLWDRWRALDANLDRYAGRRPTETAVVVLEPVPEATGFGSTSRRI